MKWLARLRLPYDLAAKNKLYDAYEWHRSLWRAFPDCDGHPRDFLSRVDKTEREYVAYLLSKRKPVCPNWCPPEYWDLAEIKESFLSYDYYRFDIVANPTKTIAKFDASGNRMKNGRRVAFLKKDEQMDWLRRKADHGGFQLVEDYPIEIDKPLNPTGHYRHVQIRHIGIRFRGVLKVIDRECFSETFSTGIGPAKGFGFGMLMLQPLTI